jgi:amidase
MSKMVNVLTADVKQLKPLLECGALRSVDLVEEIEREDGYPKAMISTPTRSSLRVSAIILEEKRASGRLQSPLHGIPVIFKVIN